MDKETRSLVQNHLNRTDGNTTIRSVMMAYRRSMSRTYSPKQYMPSKSKKFRWHDGQGRQLTAGGILPYDESGIWVIGEKNKDNIVFTDIGGKYQYQDGDIYKTIAREFGEEVYHSCDLTRKQVLDISQKFPPVYVNGHQNKPVYVCYIVPYEHLLSIDVVLDPDQFLTERRKVIQHNPLVPPDYYNSVVLKKLLYTELVDLFEHNKTALSHRLKGVLRSGMLSRMVFQIPPPPSSTPPPDDLDDIDEVTDRLIDSNISNST